MEIGEKTKTDEGEVELWAVAEFMGHKRLAGWVTEAEMFGAKLLRIDIYCGDGVVAHVTQFYHPQSLYCLTPTSEQSARKMMKHFDRPSQPYSLPEHDGELDFR